MLLLFVCFFPHHKILHHVHFQIRLHFRMESLLQLHAATSVQGAQTEVVLLANKTTITFISLLIELYIASKAELMLLFQASFHWWKELMSGGVVAVVAVCFY